MTFMPSLTAATKAPMVGGVDGGAAMRGRFGGGASSADELVAYNDFGADVSTTAGTFTIAASTITLQN